MNILRDLRSAFAKGAPEKADGAEFAHAVKAVADPKFGDYQANGCMALRKTLGRDPRELAQEVVGRVDLDAIADPLEIAGPGFINVRLKNEYLAALLSESLKDEGRGLDRAEPSKTIVVDFSSPNVAKPMHVGHLRSTVIGDSLARILESLGHRVVRDNHLGDWGAQFGMIIWGWKNERDEAAFAADPVHELARLYRLVQTRIKSGEKSIEDAARLETVKLHQGDPENRALWERFNPACLNALHSVYERLNIRFDVELGESFYDPMLAEVVADLKARGMAVESEGATVVFVPGSKTPFLIQKTDGAFNYSTTDLATIQYRRATWNPDRVLYVVDHRQSDHFKLLFDVAKRWGFENIDMVHVPFGTILGKDRRPYKTREGDVIGLESLLDEAVSEARKVIDANSPELDETERARVAEVVGLGAIKYADLSQNRLSDYVFDWSKMLAMNGNTATYLQYAYARIQNIFRKCETTPELVRALAPPIVLSRPSERALGLAVLQFPEAVETAADELKPNVLTDDLFDLANKFSTFYEDCPVFSAETPALRSSRLALCDLTSRTLRFGLELLGIDVVDRM